MNVKIIKKDSLDNKELEKYYEYLLSKKIKIVDDIELADMIITFGGDGTILHISEKIKDLNIPILAINYGKIGYLAEIKKEEFEIAIDKVLENKYRIDKRYFLKIKINDDIYYALNEASILKRSFGSKLINISLYEEDIFINNYRADGIIISSPTGSTAYSLSAGGPIIYPTLNAICITPLSPQTLSARAIVLSGDKNIKARYMDEEMASINIDGNKYIDIYNDTEIEITLSDKYISIISINSRSYYDILRNKLHWMQK